MGESRIAVLGASGLIGHALACDLKQRGFSTDAYARQFTAAQVSALAPRAVETALVTLSQTQLSRLLADADIVVNCIGVLQGSSTALVHRTFAHQLATLCASEPKRLLIQFSVPGDNQDDPTAFSRSKREAEAVILASGAPHVILRPGFVIAPNAYGGSALMRALSALPVRLPKREAARAFAAVSMEDICETVAQIASRWREGQKDWRQTWDLMEETPGTVGDLIEAFRTHGGGPLAIMTIPSWLIGLGGRMGDIISLAGWMPAMRSTAIRELRRGVSGDPLPWIVETGISPLCAKAAIAAIVATVQEKWFARLYLIKALAIVVLVAFWLESGLLALTVAFKPARAILLAHGISVRLANAITIATSLADVLVGLAVAWRPSYRLGLLAGIAISSAYVLSAIAIAPDLWVDPLGALVKTLPAIVLMLICLALADAR